MKLRLMTKLLLLVCWLSGFAPVAQAFYNPSTGRWLSRDPIEEKGGYNLHAFLGEDPINRVDTDGRRPFPIPFPFDPIPRPRGPRAPQISLPSLPSLGDILRKLCPQCGDKPYNPLTQCCVDGRVLEKKEVETGVVVHTWRLNANGAGQMHVWITWEGGSADSNSDEMYRAGGPGNRQVRSPAGYVSLASDPGYSNEPWKLSPCKYDFEKLNACLSRVAEELNGQVFGLCWDLPPHLKSTCAAESKR
jgi:hypothetical protein